MPRVALGLEYEGTAFHGWQTQSTVRSVQAELECALSRVADEPIGVIAAGRTDAGVHAVCQVVHFDTEAKRPLSAWQEGTNVYLPRDIKVLWARVVPDDFHARYSATERTYRYYLYQHASYPALLRNQVARCKNPLSLPSMQEAAKFFLGEHDFSAFRSSECQAKTPIRSVSEFEIREQGKVYRFVVSANAFLHHMVRKMIAALVEVGMEHYPPSWIKQCLETGISSKQQASLGMAPASGLYLWKVRYDARFGLPDVSSLLHDFWV